MNPSESAAEAEAWWFGDLDFCPGPGWLLDPLTWWCPFSPPPPPPWWVPPPPWWWWGPAFGAESWRMKPVTRFLIEGISTLLLCSVFLSLLITEFSWAVLRRVSEAAVSSRFHSFTSNTQSMLGQQIVRQTGGSQRMKEEKRARTSTLVNENKVN